MFKLLTFTVTLFFCIPLYALEKTFNPQIAISELPHGSDVALMIADLESGHTIFSQGAKQLRPPASVQKLVTALAAKLYFKNGYQFQTTLETHQDDIIMHFTGDPTLSRGDIKLLLDKLKTSKNTIEGNFYLNGAAFDDYERAIGLPWDILGVCYSAPSSGISLDGNCVSGKLFLPASASNNTSVLLPADAPVRAQSKAVALPASATNNHCELKLSANENNQYSVGGCVAKNKLPMPLNFAVQNTTIYTARIIHEELQQADIKLTGNIIRNDDVTGTVIASHLSQPLSQLIEIMVRDSDNLIADNLTKTLGHLYFNQPGSFENGVAAIKDILKNEAGIDLSTAMMADGSGLSRNNRLTASQIMQVVAYIFRHQELGLVQAMPISGENGTLFYRSSIRSLPLKGTIIAKSGSLYGTYNLAGMLKARSGKSLLFVQLVSNYHTEHDEIIDHPIMQFERTLYRSLFNNF
ncbi:D-alanyl-D-alanine carboxypeptidase/D-alanyl-D-alanine-endopeptidase [Methylophaga sp. OBS4]|uniref:D-alanyl-D-alanine carboxypeptidase/D-alanyl-D-alanine endopeptidase n=1 Tax=Methylophaga sp. OBS4 TaxID=2991935 RepID=UPI00224F697B|nr:D-alanyl-D-alanine carboxypeptidase/D-alanyl-D-alanine-endopeptidase [Methylophaga sp. OBS4]MCX4186898.1 D-alanyl-D-alanine carboxypeptidase/D-alanyl-D-alanine-endopeptidase [Methylophaga sp. OBS4]